MDEQINVKPEQNSNIKNNVQNAMGDGEKKSKWWVYVIIAVVVLGLLVGGWFIYSTLFANLDSQQVKLQSSIKTGEFVEVNNGENLDYKVFANCQEENCIHNLFSECKDLIIKYKYENLEQEFSLLGMKDGFCEGKIKLVAGDAGLIGKSMTCLYNNSLPFDVATEFPENCEGELASL